MKIFISTISLLILFAAFILFYSFHYPGEIFFLHLLVQGLLTLTVVSIILLIRHFIVNQKAAFICANTAGLLFWLFLCFFYPVIIGSNYFWGNTITFDILKNYLVSFDSVLSILPVDKWILKGVLFLYLIIVVAIYYLIRIRNSFFQTRHTPILGKFRKKNFLLILLLLASAVFFLRNDFMALKRTLHFKQEPLLYFTLGPMWETHSDELLVSSHKRSTEDDKCIDAIKNKQDKNKIVIILLLDALRNDHLPMYGYERNTTPFLTKLYEEGSLMRIKNSFSTSTNTVGGISGLFYSKDWKVFNYSQLNLMQYFKLSGYSTYAFLTGYHSGWYGLSAMYRANCDNFYESTSAYNVATDDDLVTLKKIEATKLTTGSFAFIHLLSTHMIGKKNEQFRRFLPDKIGLSANKKEALINNYDNGIVQGDYVIEKIFSKLRTEGLLDKATIFIVGDHGDLLGDDNLYGHAGGLHEKLLEVPILIYDQDLSWYKESAIASLKDIAPTLSDRIFGEIPFCWQGSSLHKKSPSFYSTIVSSATAKSEMSNGLLLYRNDTVRLTIYNEKGELQKESIKTDSISWKKIDSH